MRAFVLLGLFFYRTKQRDSPRKRLRNDLFCVEWDVKPQLNQARSKIVTGHFADTARVVCGAGQSLKKRAWRHGRAWKMKIRAWKN